ncbi:MAG: hypothetical protein ABJB01_07985 [Rudaea sp.]
MRKASFVYFFAIVAAAVSPLAMAGAGQTSSGVTTTVGTDPTAASAGVQSQSSNFVQENAAIQNGTPVASANRSGGAPGANGNTAAGNAANGTGKPGDPNSPAIDPKTGQPVVAVAVPAVPPPPPPDYVSNIKKVDRSASSGVALAAVDPEATAGDVVKPQAKPVSDAPVPTAPSAPGTQRQTAATPRVARAASDSDKRAAANHPANAAGGGSGSAPDSFAFYVGLIIAGALLFFAAATFMRSDKSGGK